MIHLSRSSRRSALLGALALIIAIGSAQAVVIFQLHNHPDLDENPTYGLRLNDLIGGNTVFEFDFDHPGAAIYLTYDETLKVIEISGTVYGGKIEGGAYVNDPSQVGFWDLNFRYTANVSDNTPIAPELLEIMVNPADGFANSGSIQLQGQQTAVTFYEDISSSFSGNSFLFAPNGVGLPDTYPTDTFVGRGWLSYNQDNTSSTGVQDWKFTAEVVPEPSSTLLIAIGSASLLMRRSRKT